MPNDRRRTEDGQYSPEYSDEEVLLAVRRHSPASTKEVAQEVGYEQRSSADYRLRQLEERGLVKSKKVGRELVWMLAEGVDEV